MGYSNDIFKRVIVYVPAYTFYIPPQNPAINCAQNSSYEGKIAIYCKKYRTSRKFNKQHP